MRSKTLHQHQAHTDTEPSSMQHIKETYYTTVDTTQDIMPKPLTADRHEALLQMQMTVKWEGTTAQSIFVYTHKGTTVQTCHGCQPKFMALIIPKAWKYTVLVEAHDKLRHQGVTHTYCLMK